LDIGAFKHALNRALALYSRIDDGPDKKAGGFVTVASRFDCSPIVPPTSVGVCEEGRRAKCSFLSAEKATRLFRNLSQGHVSSSQSRDPHARPFGHWGGSIAGHDGIYSLDGLSERGNEAVMLWTAVMVDDLALPQAEVIARITRNTLFEEIGMGMAA
jgi:hypothetical protein